MSCSAAAGLIRPPDRPPLSGGIFPVQWISRMVLFKRNVLIFHLGALGDFVLSWPLAMALARIHPQSRIIYVTHAQKGALAAKVLRVESSDIESGWHHLHGDATRLPEGPRKLLAGAHAIYTFLA